MGAWLQSDASSNKFNLTLKARRTRLHVEALGAFEAIPLTIRNATRSVNPPKASMHPKLQKEHAWGCHGQSQVPSAPYKRERQERDCSVNVFFVSNKKSSCIMISQTFVLSCHDLPITYTGKGIHEVHFRFHLCKSTRVLLPSDTMASFVYKPTSCVSINLKTIQTANLHNLMK